MDSHPHSDGNDFCSRDSFKPAIIWFVAYTIKWIILFLGPLLGLSYVYERVTILRPFISIIGIPIAVIGNEYVALLPSMGEMDSRYAKMIICQTFPYSWRFNQFENNKVNINSNDILNHSCLN